MNILFLSELYYPQGGGAELATHLYARLLSRKGFNVIVVTNRFDGEAELYRSERLTIYRLPLFKGTGSVKYSILARVDVLLSHFIGKLIKWADVVYVPRFWFAAIILAKAYKKPVVTHLHDYIPVCPLSNSYNASERAICRLKNGVCSLSCLYAYEKSGQRATRAAISSMFLNSTFGRCFNKIAELSDLVICVSKAQKDLIIARNPRLRSTIRVVYNPLPETPRVSMLGNDFGYFGGPSIMKGFQVLCLAANYVKRVRHKSIRIHATKFYDPADGYLRRNVAQLGISTYGKLDKAQYDDLYDHIGTVIVPSVWAEPLPYVVIEAAVNGKIIVASRVGGIPEQVAGCDGAYLYDAGDYEQLADKLLHIEGLSIETLCQFGIKNRTCVMRRFDNEKIVNDFIGLLQSVSS